MVEVNLVTIGILAVIVGFILILVGSFFGRGKTQVEGGGVVFIGPIPIIGATSERALYIVLAITIIFLLLFVVLNYFR
jgi:uncharacterized membrane protein